jgi:hypothetical protein
MARLWCSLAALRTGYGNIQPHDHFDIRFLFVGDENEEYVVSDESNELRWVPMEQIETLTDNNASISRMVMKTNSIFM